MLMLLPIPLPAYLTVHALWTCVAIHPKTPRTPVECSSEEAIARRCRSIVFWSEVFSLRCYEGVPLRKEGYCWAIVS